MRGKSSKTIRHIRFSGPQTENFRIGSQGVLGMTVVYAMHKHPVLLYPIRQSLPMSRTVIILKFKTMKKSRGFASFAERAAVHGVPRALYRDTG